MAGKALVLDANILVRAVLGNRVRQTIEDHLHCASFFVPEAAYAEAKHHLGLLVVKRGGDPAIMRAAFSSLGGLIELMSAEV